MTQLDGALTLKQRRAKPRQKRDKPVKVARIEPTQEQLDKNRFKSAGMAYRKTPVIDTMLAKEQITSAQYVALNYYREQASAADRSCIKSNIDFSIGTGIQRPMGHQTPQEIETHRIERDLGKLRPIARAIAVDDYSLTEWCLEQHGGNEVLRGKNVVIEPSQKNMKRALLELRYAAGMIVI